MRQKLESSKRQYRIGVHPLAVGQDNNMSDPIVDEVRRVREELINRYGGIDGYFKHCQSQDRARAASPERRARKQRSKPARKSKKTP